MAKRPMYAVPRLQGGDGYLKAEEQFPGMTSRILIPEGVAGYIPVYKTKKAARAVYGKDVEMWPLQFDDNRNQKGA